MTEDQEKSTNRQVVDGVSELIASELTALSSEHWQPRFGADQMEDELQFRRERVKRLRAIRNEFEDLMHGLKPQ